MEDKAKNKALANNSQNTLKQIELPDGNKLDIETVKKYLVTGNPQAVTEGEVIMFLQQCKALQLNPFLKECYLIKYGSLPAQIVVSYQVYKKMARQVQNYQGLRSGIIVMRNNEMIELEGTCKMTDDIIVGGWCIPLYEGLPEIKTTVSYSEVVALKDGRPNQRWAKAPGQMTEKCAIAAALRNTLPENFSGTYIEEEMGYMEENAPIDTESKKTTILETIERNNANIQDVAQKQFVDTKKEEKQATEQATEIQNVEIIEEKLTTEEKPLVQEPKIIKPIGEPITGSQRMELLKSCNMDANLFTNLIKQLGYSKSSEIPSSKYDEVLEFINSKKG